MSSTARCTWTTWRSTITMDRIWREYFAKAPPARAGARRPSDADRHAGGDQRGGDPGPVAKEAHRAAGYPAQPLVDSRSHGGRPALPVGILRRGCATGKVPDRPDAQVQLALDNMKQTLAAAGLDFRHVVFVNPYLTDKASAQMNAIYAKHFEFGNTPARATIRVASLPRRQHDSVHGRRRRGSVEAGRRASEEHASERDRQPVCLRRRHLLLLGQGTVHARTRQGAGHFCLDRRGPGPSDHAQPARRPRGSRLESSPTSWPPTSIWTTSTIFRA